MQEARLVTTAEASHDRLQPKCGRHPRHGRFRDAAEGTEVAMLAGHEGPVYDLAFSPDGKLLVSGSRDKSMRVWDVEAGDELFRMSGFEDFVRAGSREPTRSQR